MVAASKNPCDPRKLIESVADVLAAAQIDFAQQLKQQSHQLSKSITSDQNKDKLQNWVDAVRCLQSISTAYVSTVDDDAVVIGGAGPANVGGGGRGWLFDMERSRLPGTRPHTVTHDDETYASDAISTQVHSLVGHVCNSKQEVSDNELHSRVDAILAETLGWQAPSAFAWSDEAGAGGASLTKRMSSAPTVPRTSTGEEEDRDIDIDNEDLEDDDPDLASIAGTAIYKRQQQIGGSSSSTSGSMSKKRGRKDQEGNLSSQPSQLPNGHYTQRRRRIDGTTYETEEDEYKDDEDPGYRLLPLTEQQLMEELKHSEPYSKLPGELDPIPSPPDTEDDSKEEGESSLASDPTLGRRKRGGKVRKLPWVDKMRSAGKKKRRLAKGVKHSISNDEFYPVEMNGTVFDCFHLRVVFERQRTGFEETKEFKVEMGQIIAARYQVVEFLGAAAFSRAVQCHDLETNRMVCLKIIKNDKDFVDQSLDEIKLLSFININCEDADEKNVLRLIDFFYHKEHLVLVTELLKDNLYEFSKFNREQEPDKIYFNKRNLQAVSREILVALEYIHSLNLIHCDLKPENILMKSYSRCEVKVIDFGSSCFIDDHLSSYVQSRSYRAPEVILGCPYDQKIDIWSLGCILAELWTGYVLFQNDSVHALLARVLGIMGRLPFHVMASGKHVPTFFTQDGRLYQEEGNKPGDPEGLKRLSLLIPKRTTLGHRLSLPEGDPLLDFIGCMLNLDPTRRPSATECLQHPFLTDTAYQEDN
ncbi:unnamed protein product [Amoebophrya sp. A25]|nr:unnamed protein product [Amoebophrya sp. A25]|eukprot:GSA25T00023827001.1